MNRLPMAQPPRWTIGRMLAVILTIATLLGMLCAIVIDRTVQAQQIETIGGQTADHEARLRLIEQQLAQIAADVRWIRREMEQRGPP